MKPYKLVPLTRGLVAAVDAEDYERAMTRNWRPEVINVRIKRVLTHVTGGVLLPLGRFILDIPTGGGIVVDHWNRNPLDCRKCNLRRCTPTENIRNRGHSKRHAISSTKYRGVTKDVRCKAARFTVHIQQNGRRKHLGVYATAAEGARAYDKAARELHGVFATLNFPEPYEMPPEVPPELINQMVLPGDKDTKRHRPKRELPTGIRSIRNRFVAQKTIRGKTTYLGTFDTVEQATATYNAALDQAEMV